MRVAKMAVGVVRKHQSGDEPSARPAVLAIVLWSVAFSGCLEGQAAEPTSPTTTRDVSGPHLYLLNDEASALEIAVHQVAGRELDPAVLNDVAAYIKGVTGKRQVTVLAPVGLDVGTPSEDRNWTGQKVSEFIASRNLGVDQPAVDTARLTILSLDGYGYTYGAMAQGMSHGAVVSLFPDVYRHWVVVKGSIKLGHREDPQTDHQVLVHEIGHSVGLVNDGVPMVSPHLSDDECLCHSNNPDSVMYVRPRNATPQKDPVASLQRLAENPGPVLTFAEDDMADIRAFQQAHAVKV